MLEVVLESEKDNDIYKTLFEKLIRIPILEELKDEVVLINI